MNNATSNQDDLALMRRATREAGELALGFFGDQNNSTWCKGDGSAVSDADIAVDRLLHERLLADRADYGWLSEETEDDQKRLHKKHVWIVDPIDGTRAFLSNKPHWLVSVALVVEGVVQLGCLYNPVSDEFFEAERGRGAFLNGKPISMEGQKQIEGATIIVAQGRLEDKNWPQPWPAVNSFMVNSVAYRMALVASNKADAMLALSGKSDWDLAAADLLVREAGGRVSDHKGNEFTFNRKNTRHQSVLVANPDLYAKMLARTKQVEARKRHGCGHNE
ncbi:MAG: 3'(2'),5'-bisphosphate nucleotidase CysQ [Hyphomicrobiaceae bacterium]|nr:3'(2'),5'-bisphosphate nucleotidase CysQ [Hyphomicrobiaceae bacterium]